MTLPGISEDTATSLVSVLQRHLAAHIDLALTFKHVHWNVVGPNFIAVHEMLDPWADAALAAADATAERIAALGGAPQGTCEQVAYRKSWGAYSLGVAPVEQHLNALEAYLAPIVGALRADLHDFVNEHDVVWAGPLSEHVATLDQYLWFIRAHSGAR